MKIKVFLFCFLGLMILVSGCGNVSGGRTGSVRAVVSVTDNFSPGIATALLAQEKSLVLQVMASVPMKEFL